MVVSMHAEIPLAKKWEPWDGRARLGQIISLKSYSFFLGKTVLVVPFKREKIVFLTLV